MQKGFEHNSAQFFIQSKRFFQSHFCEYICTVYS